MCSGKAAPRSNSEGVRPLTELERGVSWAVRVASCWHRHAPLSAWSGSRCRARSRRNLAQRRKNVSRH
jgi:hypothetical protein